MRVVVPEGMLEAVDRAIGEMRTGQASRLASRDGELWPNDLKHVVLESALVWLAEHPIVPTDAQVADMRKTLVTVHPHWANIVAEWQRRMFVPAEPEVPESIKDLIMPLDLQFVESHPAKHSDRNWAVLEAYRRGQKDGKQ